MDYTTLSRISLKNLTVMHVLLMTHSVTATADILCVTPSSVSKALSQLKTQLNDDLFFRRGNQLTPTQFALSIGPAIHNVLSNINGIFQQGEFSPEVYEGTLSLSMRESTFELFAPKLCGISAQLSDKARLNISTKEQFSFEALQSGKLDFLLLPHDISQPPTQSKSLVWQTIMEDEMVCLMRADHPLAQQDLTIEGYLSCRHIRVIDKDLAEPYFEMTLTQRHGARNIALMVADFGSAALTCHHSDYLFTCSKRWAETALQAKDLVAKPLPFDYGQVAYSLVWNMVSLNNPACRWLHSQLIAES
ncbi:LysR substrate-binding domain-containing protein [Enterovibrio sp. ZSDZ35]|uniref:LysR substrate-binding domain-containing protein n=1 Tax=Enterovibrio qingdaonensis TaxID=2899818 RepID=A0ABT5QR41_9GAMM|nr:LysR family transcriptional regulator [Enterovibrio sp. ZSDZ35]MDD1783440.1 LysR substrate-binding domain-containing protein [Enterovibrio sp. ZSDZ35]